MKTLAITALLASLALTACQRDEPRGVADITGRMFVFNYRVGQASYLVTLKRTAPIKDGSRFDAEFENPRGGAAIVLSGRLWPKDERIIIQSPPVECVKRDRSYQVTIRLKAPDGHVMQTIETSIISDTDQSLLPAKSLVVGPLYTPNPEVFRPDGTVNMMPAQGCPAS
jgi:hypothetical protein